jgi:D-2-hydroxyacid dehydrogenase (NADP+)
VRIAVGVELEAAQWTRMREAYPQFEFVNAPDREQLLQIVVDCDILYGGHPKAEHINAAPNLRWVQSYSAGINHFPIPELSARNIPLTNASGAHGAPISENILSMMFAFAVRIPDFVRAQEKKEWVSHQISPDKFELEGQTLLVVGVGAIGKALARKARALGMTVIGVRNRPLPSPDVDEVLPHERLHEALSRADHVALCLPLTPETTAYIREAELRAMKKSAYIYNVGRGQNIDQQALVKALNEGWIAGAGLDVTEKEPLPPDDPLWDAPNTILTQHSSGHSNELDERVTTIFLENLRRFLAGEPLNNLVDYERGY